MADDIFELIKLASRARAGARTGKPEELSEAEFLALDALAAAKSMTVGDLQKVVGVLPAQMSRIIRSLENKGGETFVTCAINPQDRRKVDVRIASAGSEALRAYRATRHGFAIAILKDLSRDDRRQFMHMLDRIRNGLAKRLNAT